MKKLWHILILWFLVAFSACIPIEDRIAVQIVTLEGIRNYNVPDTIRLRLVATDNFALDSLNIRIERETPPSSPTPFVYAPAPIKLRGRRIEDTLKIPIPKTTPVGNYRLQLSLWDKSRKSTNAAVRDTVFQILADNKAPNFVAIEPVGLSRDANGNYIVCRSSVIRLNGLIVDNVRVRDVRASFPNNLLNAARVTNQDTVRLRTLFDNDLRIPTDTPDGTVLPLSIIATDVEGNVAAPLVIRFVVNCDDQAPVINIVETNPNIGNAREISLVEGSSLQFVKGDITDNNALQSITISFNELNQNRQVIVSRTFSNTTTKTITLEQLLPNPLTLPSSAVAGSQYEFIITARDLAGNVSVPYRLVITVRRDEPPILFIANVYIDGREIAQATQISNLSVLAGQTLQVEGKVEEDRALEYFRINFGLAGTAQLPNLINLNTAQIKLPFDFADPLSTNRFRIPENARAGQQYVLEIRVKDLKNPEVLRRFILTVN